MPNPAKIHPRLAEAMRARGLVERAELLQIIVRRRAGAAGKLRALRDVVEPHRTFSLIPATAHRAARQDIELLSEQDDVEIIWLDSVVHTMLDQSAPLIGAPQVWAKGVTGKGIQVAVIDTGIDPDHPDFIDRVLDFKDFTGEGEFDLHGHGTHVAGIVGGSGAASFDRYRGIAFECSLLIGKVLNSNGEGRMSDVIAGIEWAIQRGARVVNLSLGDDRPCDGTDALSQACEVAVALGAVVCVAAGNSGPSAYTIGSPACAQSVITVGATTKEDRIVDFSSRGPTLDERTKPDLCFPGVNIVSCRAAGTSRGSPVDQFYTALSGTSMATPHASGAGALVLEKNPSFSPQDVKALLMATAKDLGLDANTQGAGRGDIAKAFSQHGISDVVFEPTTLDVGNVLNVSITVVNQSDVTLPTQGPDPNTVYEEGETFYARGFADVKGAFRVGVDFDRRANGVIDHPYRWGLGAPLAPGETRVIAGAIRLKTAQTQDYWVGLVEERVRWSQDRVGVQSVAVNSPQQVALEITSVTFSPTTLFADNLLNVSITVRNAGAVIAPTASPDPGFVYDEGDTFESRGFTDVAGSCRVGVDFDNRAGIDHPYRWGLGAPLALNESRVISGAIRLRAPQSRNYWAGVVQERIRWIADRAGAQKITVLVQEETLAITNVTFSPTTVDAENLLNVSITVQNRTNAPLPTQGPDPGFVYEEGDTFISRGFADARGSFRVGVDCDNRAGIDHPYRWGLGSPLAMGETRTITGAIRLKSAQAQNYWAGLVQEHFKWFQDRTGTTLVTVRPADLQIVSVVFTPTTLQASDLLNVSITVRNNSTNTLPTQGPAPAFVYDEGDTFESREFTAVPGNYRVGVDFDNRAGIDHPYRWGLGASLAPGETRVITGAIRLRTAQSRSYWAGAVQEYVRWWVERVGEQVILVR